MRAYFLSDLHLGAPYFEDSRESEMRVVRFLDSIKDDADVIYLLGDILDYWYEYRNVVPRGFVRFFGKLAELSDAGISITWFIGNHDIWIFDYIPNELGIDVVDGSRTIEINGKKFFLSHGDGVGKIPMPFRLIRNIFRNRVCQKLYASVHPRWTIPFALSWSKSSRDKSYANNHNDYTVSAQPLIEFSKDYLARNKDIDFFIYGHLHILFRSRIAEHSEIVILGEWIHTCSYAVFDGENLFLYKYKY